MKTKKELVLSVKLHLFSKFNVTRMSVNDLIQKSVELAYDELIQNPKDTVKNYGQDLPTQSGFNNTDIPSPKK